MFYISTVCEAKFYRIKEFLKHFTGLHLKELLSLKCVKCKKIANRSNFKQHFENCYGIKQYQCAFCVNGFSALRSVEQHLADHHATKYPVFWDRNEILKNSSHSIQLVFLQDINETSSKM